MMNAVQLIEKSKSGIGLTKEEELVVSTDPSMSYDYAEINKCRFLEGEDSISKSRGLSIRYAMHIIKGRFELAEHYWKNDYDWCFDYATLALKARFELGEDAIRKSKLKNRYQKMFNCKLEKAKEVETDDWELMRRKFISKMKDMKR